MVVSLNSPLSVTLVSTVVPKERLFFASVAFEKNVMIGTKFSVGLGLVTPTEVKNNLSFGTTVETSVTESGEFKETTTFSTGFQTSGDPTGVGANADLFIGKLSDGISVRNSALSIS